MNDIKSLYVHIPFCEHICDYCDFPKLQYFTLFAKPYLKRLKEELDSYKIRNQLETIYIGGGTPTALEDDLFIELFEILKPYANGVKEFTVEANPESLSEKKLEIMKKYGINRISIGVESTNDEILKSINRHQTYEDVKKAILKAKQYGFDNLNVDLILGLPGASLDDLKKDLTNLTSLDVQHISCYSLTVHPNTIFGIKGIQEPVEDTSRELYDYAHKFLEEKGFIHYEVSNWAKEGKQSLHNMTYWKNERYYGAGLGAAGYVDNYRYTNTRSITKYLKGEFLDDKEVVGLSDETEYQVMLNLRTIEGLDLREFQDKFKEDLLKTKEAIIKHFIEGGYLLLENDKLIPTYEGMMILDQIIVALI